MQLQLARIRQKTLGHQLEKSYEKLQSGIGRPITLEDRSFGISLNFDMVSKRVSQYWVKIVKHNNIRSQKLDLRLLSFAEFRLILNEMIADLLRHPQVSDKQFITYVNRLQRSQHVIRRGKTEYLVNHSKAKCSFRLSCYDTNTVFTTKYTNGRLEAKLPVYCKTHLKEILERNNRQYLCKNYYPF